MDIKEHISKYPQVTEAIRSEIKTFLQTNANENMTIKTYGMQQKQFYEGSL